MTFGYKDYADGRKHKTMTLPAEEFLRRVLQHVLPQGFVKVRHYGLLANRRREQRLHRCHRLLPASPPSGGEPNRRRRAWRRGRVVRGAAANASSAAPWNRSLRLRRRRSRRRAIRHKARRAARTEQVWKATAAPSRRRKAAARRSVGPEKGNRPRSAVAGSPPRLGAGARNEGGKGLRSGERRSTMAWSRSGAGSKAHSRRRRGSVQRESIPHAPPAYPRGHGTPTPAEHAG